MTPKNGGPEPPRPERPLPLRGLSPRSTMLREAFLKLGHSEGAPRRAPVSWLGARLGVHVRYRSLTDRLLRLALRAAISFVGLFAKPGRPRSKAKA